MSLVSCHVHMQGQEVPWQDQGMHLRGVPSQQKIDLSTRMLQSLKAEKRCCTELKEAADAYRLAGDLPQRLEDSGRA